MKLTNAEKLMILLLCDIKDGREECDTDLIRNAILYDHAWAITWELSGANWDEEDVPPYVREVTNILDMFSFLEASYDALDAEGKSKVDAAEMSMFKRYRGFDGNNEGRYLSCVDFFVGQMNRWDEFKGRERLNSHMQVLPAYRRMLPVWESIRDASITIDTLSADDIIKIISAAKYVD